MFTILLHSSKTMRSDGYGTGAFQPPRYIVDARQLARYVASLSPATIQKVMGVSAPLADKTLTTMTQWGPVPAATLPAIDAFLGDIYSGLQVATFDDEDRTYANETLLILSGLYGALKALDSVSPYRLEMGYKLPDEPFANLYHYWDSKLADAVPAYRTIINVSAAEYTRALLPYLKTHRIITPKFLTLSPKTGEPSFVTVHAKIARGAYAHWLIKNRIEKETDLASFDEIGYMYDRELSTEFEPVYVAEKFDGLGLSVRLT